MLEVETERCVNFSLLQNNLQWIIRRLVVPEGKTATVTVTVANVTTQPWFFEAGDWRNASLPLDAMSIGRRSHAQQAQVRVSCPGHTDVPRDLTILPIVALDTRREYAAAMASFVLENDPFVTGIVGMANVVSVTRDPSISLRDICERLYDRVQRAVGRYAFERGVIADWNREQIVRPPTQMLARDRAGTCIDLSLFFAAVAYAAGLRPIIILLGEEYGERHALVAIESGRHGAPSTVLSAEYLGEAMKHGRLLPVETTGFARNMDFDAAVREGTATMQWPILWGVSISAARTRFPQIQSLPEAPMQTVFSGLPALVVDTAATTRRETAADLFASAVLEEVVASQPDGIPRSWSLRDPVLSIGRGDPNTIALTAMSVSRTHAVLFVSEGEIWIEDLFSSLGTFVDGVKLSPMEPARVPVGSILRLGDQELRVMRHGI